MNSYVLEYANGAIDELCARDDDHAVSMALNILRDLGHDDAVAADQWDSDGTNDDGEPMKRILIWSCEEDAQNDSGAKSIAQLTTGGAA
jgi:hypothetical protein